MDYLEIVLQGYFNENNREHLERYFFREFKKAEKEHYEADEFFRGCLKVIEGWEKYLQQEVFERKKELYLMLNAANNGTLKHADLEGKTIEEKNQEVIEYCKQELASISESNFTVHLSSLTNGRVAYNMWYYEVLNIKLAILNAIEKIESSNAEQQKEIESRKADEPKNLDSLQELFEMLGKVNDFEPLKKYIRENYLNVHPNKFTLERLEQIKRNISTWKLQLKDLNEAPDLQQFISEVIADIDLKIGRFGTGKKETEHEFSYIENKESETVQSEFSETIKKELEPLRQAFNNDTDFQKAITAIQNFFLGKGNPEQPIFVKNSNTRNLAFALGEIWKSYKNKVITYDYLHFYRQTFSIFNKEKYKIDEAESIFSHLLYKYSISKA